MSGVFATSEMRAFLESDLYKEVERPDPPYAVAMVSPLGWRVEWSIYKEGNPKSRVRCRILDPKGQVYRSTDDADAYWLENVLP